MAPVHPRNVCTRYTALSTIAITAKAEDLASLAWWPIKTIFYTLVKLKKGETELDNSYIYKYGKLTQAAHILMATTLGSIFLPWSHLLSIIR